MNSIFKSFIKLTMVIFSIPLLAADIEVVEPWVRATPPAQKMTAGYFKLVNNSTSTLVVKAVICPFAETCTIHQTETLKGVSRMKPIKSLKIPPAKAVLLQPGAKHLMIMGLKKPLKTGEYFPIELYFDNGKHILINATINK